MDVSFLRPGEQLIRIHTFRFMRAQGCALGGVTIRVEESLSPAIDPAERCIARPDHPERFPKPQFLATGGTVEAALQNLLEKVRPHPAHDLFLPTA